MERTSPRHIARAHRSPPELAPTVLSELLCGSTHGPSPLFFYGALRALFLCSPFLIGLRTEAKHSFGPLLLVLISSLFLLSNIIFKSTPTFLRPCSSIPQNRKGGSCFWRRIRINRLYIFSNHRATLY